MWVRAVDALYKTQTWLSRPYLYWLLFVEGSTNDRVVVSTVYISLRHHCFWAYLVTVSVFPYIALLTASPHSSLHWPKTGSPELFFKNTQLTLHMLLCTYFQICYHWYKVDKQLCLAIKSVSVFSSVYVATSMGDNSYKSLHWPTISIHYKYILSF